MRAPHLLQWREKRGLAQAPSASGFLFIWGWWKSDFSLNVASASNSLFRDSRVSQAMIALLAALCFGRSADSQDWSGTGFDHTRLLLLGFPRPGPCFVFQECLGGSWSEAGYGNSAHTGTMCRWNRHLLHQHCRVKTPPGPRAAEGAQ